MTTATEVAHTAQTNVIKALSQQIWGSEWIILDEYGDSNGNVDRTLAAKLIDALHDVRKLPIDQLDDAQKLDALAKVLAGEALPEAYNPQPAVEAQVQPVVEAAVDLGEPFPRPAWQRLDQEDEPDPIKEDATATKTYKPRALKPIEHGTYRGFQAHQRRGETPCEDCVQGKREYQQQGRLAKNPGLKPRARRAPTASGAKPTPKARSNGARNSAQVEVEPHSDWNARFYEIAISGLVSLLPKTHTEPFAAVDQSKWLHFASVVIPLVWPES